MELYHLHPIAVHFPIALLTLGAVSHAVSVTRGRPAWLADAASWLLWLGAVSLWAALGLGLLAEKTAPHRPLAWETLEDHEMLAFCSAGLFTALAIWRLLARRRGEHLLLLAWLISLGLVFATGYLGGKLVFKFGMGVM